MRRYFDEYRGLRETVGHVEPAPPARVGAQVARGCAATSHTCATGAGPAAAGVGAGRSLRHHAGRAVFSALGSRAERLPPAASRRRLSLEGRDRRPRRPRDPRHDPYAYVRPYFTGAAGAAGRPRPRTTRPRERLHFAWLMPPFRRGSGGHMTLFTIARRARARAVTRARSGSTTRQAGCTAAQPVAQRELIEHFAPLRGGVFHGFEDWHGADVAFATGWQTAYPLWTLGGCKLKAYLVQDYEPDFYRRVGRAAVGGGDLPHGLRLRRREPMAGGACCASATAPPPTSSSSASTSTPTAHSDVPRRRRHDRLLRAPLDAAAGDRDGPPGARRARPAAARHCESCCSATRSAPRAPFPHEFGGVLDAGLARAPLQRGDRRPRHLAHELLAHAEGDDGLRPAGRRRATIRASLSAFAAARTVIELADVGLRLDRRPPRRRCSTTRRAGARARRSRASDSCSGMTWTAAAGPDRAGGAAPARGALVTRRPRIRAARPASPRPAGRAPRSRRAGPR